MDVCRFYTCSVRKISRIFIEGSTRLLTATHENFVINYSVGSLINLKGKKIHAFFDMFNASHYHLD